MLIHDLLKKSGLSGVKGDISYSILGLSNHSKKVIKGDLFLVKNVLIEKYIREAIQNGICAILTNIPLELWKKIEIPVVYASNLEEQYSQVIYAFYGNPNEKIKFCCGITGTNGKTTISYLVQSLLKFQNKKVIQLGSIEYSIDDQKIVSSLTTPGILELASLLNKGIRYGCDSLVMEVSSHALEQKRVEGILYHRAIFTNLTQDHLDYHLNFENYYQAKKKLFEKVRQDGMGILNYDQEYGQRLLKEVKIKWMTFSRKSNAADVFLKSYQINHQGMSFEIFYKNQFYFFKTKLIGQVHLENLLAVITLGFSLNFSYKSIFNSIETVVVPGRLQPFFLNNNRLVLVDYAHTPDALKRTLKSLKELNYRRIICVFGCGGNRDREKRALMGRFSEINSDLVFITNDNPRLEEPQEIINDILKGVKQKDKVKIIPDRRKCILKVLSESEEGDCILIAGKGHEDYQILGKNKIYFSDAVVVKEYQSLC